MIKRIQTFKELPQGMYTGYLLKAEEDSNNYVEGYLITTKVNPMILLFIPYVEEINSK